MGALAERIDVQRLGEHVEKRTGTIHVSGYTRADGTKVSAYTRRALLSAIGKLEPGRGKVVLPDGRTIKRGRDNRLRLYGRGGGRAEAVTDGTMDSEMVPKVRAASAKDDHPNAFGEGAKSYHNAAAAARSIKEGNENARASNDRERRSDSGLDAGRRAGRRVRDSQRDRRDRDIQQHQAGEISIDELIRRERSYQREERSAARAERSRETSARAERQSGSRSLPPIPDLGRRRPTAWRTEGGFGRVQRGSIIAIKGDRTNSWIVVGRHRRVSEGGEFLFIKKYEPGVRLSRRRGSSIYDDSADSDKKIPLSKIKATLGY